MNTATPPTEPLGYAVWLREQKRGARWRKVATVRTHAAAVALMTSRHDWHAAPIYDPALLSAGNEGAQKSTPRRACRANEAVNDPDA